MQDLNLKKSCISNIDEHFFFENKVVAFSSNVTGKRILLNEIYEAKVIFAPRFRL